MEKKTIVITSLETIYIGILRNVAKVWLPNLWDDIAKVVKEKRTVPLNTQTDFIPEKLITKLRTFIYISIYSIAVYFNILRWEIAHGDRVVLDYLYSFIFQ